MLNEYAPIDIVFDNQYALLSLHTLQCCAYLVF